MAGRYSNFWNETAEFTGKYTEVICSCCHSGIFLHCGRFYEQQPAKDAAADWNVCGGVFIGKQKTARELEKSNPQRFISGYSRPYLSEST